MNSLTQNEDLSLISNDKLRRAFFENPDNWTYKQITPIIRMASFHHFNVHVIRFEVYEHRYWLRGEKTYKWVSTSSNGYFVKVSPDEGEIKKIYVSESNCIRQLAEYVQKKREERKKK